MENLGLVSVFVILIVSAYYVGVNRGLNAPFSFNVIESDVVVMFEAASTRDETIRKVQQELVEKQRLEKKLEKSEEMINKLQWAFYHLCDSMHNIGTNYINQKIATCMDEDIFKRQVSNASLMLDYSRSLFNKDVFKNDMAYVALMQFIENDLARNVASEPEASFRVKLDNLFEKFARSTLEEIQLDKPMILAA